jgi:hypothetical protein
MNDEDQKEYERLSDTAKELYNLIKDSDNKLLVNDNDKRLSHNDIMDNLFGYVNMDIWRNKND